MRRPFLFGLPVWYGNINSIEEEIGRAAGLGLDYVEISLDYPWPEILGKREIASLVSLGKREGMSFAFHAPPAGVEIGSPRNEIRKEAVRFMKSLMKWTCSFSPLYFNFHGDAGEAVEESEVAMLASVAACAKSCADLREYGRRTGVLPVFENTPDVVFGTSYSVDAILSSGIGFCFDIGHSQIMNDAMEEGLGRIDRPLARWVSDAGARMKALHIHNVKNQGDHYPLRTGEIDFRRAGLLLAKTSARYVTLEILKEVKGAVHKVSDRTISRSLEDARKWLARRG